MVRKSSWMKAKDCCGMHVRTMAQRHFSQEALALSAKSKEAKPDEREIAEALLYEEVRVA